MRASFVSVALVAAFAIAASVFAQQAMPRMTTVEPPNGKAGDVLTVSGENLEEANVAELFLTDGNPKNDLKVSITEQDPKSIKFKIPATAKQGRLALMLLTKGKEPKLIEQPVKVTIE